MDELTFEGLFGFSLGFLCQLRDSMTIFSAREERFEHNNEFDLEELIQQLNSNSQSRIKDSLRIIRHSKSCQRSVYENSDGSLNANRISQLFYHEKSSIYLHGTTATENTPWQPILAAVKEAMATPGVRWYLFISPPDSQGLDAHFDAHDLLIIQLHGKKLWEIWPAYTHIDEADLVPEVYFPQTRHYVDSHQPLVELTLSQGDVFFLPKGTVHLPRTRTQFSMHLSMVIPRSVKCSGKMTSSRGLLLFPTSFD